MDWSYLQFIPVQSYLDLAFCQPKMTGGGGGKMVPPNLAILSQMTMKLGRVILRQNSSQIDKKFR